MTDTTARLWQRPALVAAAGSYLVAFGPLLILPEILSAEIRPIVVPLVALGALAISLLGPMQTRVRAALAIFVLCVCVGWWRADSSEALRHTAGIAVSLLAMTAITIWSRTERRLLIAVAAFCAVALGMLLIGLSAIESHPPKFLPIRTAWLPQLKLGLTGLDRRGFVNPNGLAGTAVLIAPMAAAAAFALRGSGASRWALRAFAGTTAAVAVFALLIAQSRIAWIAVIAVLAALALHAPRWRKATVGTIAVLGTVALIAFLSPVAPDEIAIRAQTAAGSATSRMQVWRQAGALLAGAPFFGIGMNEFRHAYRPPAGAAPQTTAAHAHNMFLQTALDVGLVGLSAYTFILVVVLVEARRTARSGRGAPASLAAGGALALVAVHAFGLTDAIALGAKVGVLQWMVLGLTMSAIQLDSNRPADPAARRIGEVARTP